MFQWGYMKFQWTSVEFQPPGRAGYKLLPQAPTRVCALFYDSCSSLLVAWNFLRFWVETKALIYLHSLLHLVAYSLNFTFSVLQNLKFYILNWGFQGKKKEKPLLFQLPDYQDRKNERKQLSALLFCYVHKEKSICICTVCFNKKFYKIHSDI